MRFRRSPEAAAPLPALPVTGEPASAAAEGTVSRDPERLDRARAAAGAARRRAQALPRWVGVTVAVAFVVVAVGSLWRWWQGPDSSTEALTPAKVAQAIDDAIAASEERQARQPALATQVYTAIHPSLVIVQTDKPSAPGATSGPAPVDGSDHGLGAGVIVNDDGTILTALHVVDGATRVRVSFADGTDAEAIVAARQADKDIAVLKPSNLPEVVVPAVLGGGVQIGDEVFAVGNPLGLVGSLSAGVVSGTDRKVPIDDERTLDGLIQFDAAVNPGNSGGPLLNRAGQVVGVVTALANPSGQGFFVGVGFAVPIQTAGGAAGGPSR